MGKGKPRKCEKYLQKKNLRCEAFKLEGFLKQNRKGTCKLSKVIIKNLNFEKLHLCTSEKQKCTCSYFRNS